MGKQIASKDNIIRQQHGAAVVEFALVALFILMITLFVIDASIVFHKYLRLTHATTEATRVLSSQSGELIDLGGGNQFTCTQAQSWVEQGLANYAALRPAVSGGQSFELVRLEKGDSRYPLLVIRGSWAGTCLSCRFFPYDPEVGMNVRSVLVIETAAALDCDSPGCAVECQP